MEPYGIHATYGSTDVTVVQVNPRVNVLSALARIQQETREFDAEIHIVRAAAPSPVGQRRATALAFRIATARFQFPLAASFRYGMRNSGR